MLLRDRYEDNANDVPWPTLGEMVDKHQQILFFYMSGPNGNEEPPEGIHYFFEYGSSNHWSYSSVSELQSTMINDCPIQFTSSNRDDFLMMNAFVTEKFFGYQVKPSRNAAEQVNTGSFLEPLLDVCEAQTGQKVNIVSLDFWASGDATGFVNEHNSKLVPVPPQEMESNNPQAHLGQNNRTPGKIFNAHRKKSPTVDRLKSMEFGG